MGANQSGREDFNFGDKDVNFDHFHILRAIGKGSFGKVCIVQKKDSKQMFAMKYMNKGACAERDAMRNVLREVELLTQLEHPFLVNIWFSFQDEEDLFMVSDLLLGGDLRYHIQHQVIFSKESVALLVYELATALDYLHSKQILHRDIKPDNILLDEEGHAHITDFNIATQLGERELATSMSGTKPYMSPEIFDCAADACVGYSYPVDWWSLGVVAFEMVAGERPYDIHSQTGVSEVRQLFLAPLRLPHAMDRHLADLMRRLLCISPGGRCSTLDELRKIPVFSNLEYEAVFQKRYKPAFCPPKDHLNCDPTFELEEMIIETRPLHKKKKRLAKQKSIRDMQVGSLELASDSQNSPTIEPAIPNIIPEFITYNRYKELERREGERIKMERRLKEEEWEKELATAMGENVSLEVIGDEESSDTPQKSTERSQDGCDILVNTDNFGCFGKECNDDKKLTSDSSQNLKSDVESKEGSKFKINYLSKNKNKKGKHSSSIDGDAVKQSESKSVEAEPSPSDDANSEKTKFNSESDFMNLKKKHGKTSFERGLLSFKEKSLTNRFNRGFPRASSLKVSNSSKDSIPEKIENSKSEMLDTIPNITDNVKKRIAHSPKLKHVKSSSECQRSSTFMADASYQKTKTEVMKNYQASLCTSLQNETENT